MLSISLHAFPKTYYKDAPDHLHDELVLVNDGKK